MESLISNIFPHNHSNPKPTNKPSLKECHKVKACAPNSVSSSVESSASNKSTRTNKLQNNQHNKNKANKENKKSKNRKLPQLCLDFKLNVLKNQLKSNDTLFD